MFKYFKRLDTKINDTLNIYQELGKMSMPFFKWILLIMSFLVVTSCCAILLSFFTKSDDNEESHKKIWIHYSLPIIIYGITCPIISTVISAIFRIFIDFQINNIKNKRKYLYKKNGKHTEFKKEIGNICKYILFSKHTLIIPFSCLFFFLPLSNTIIYILILITIVFSILVKLSQYYDNNIDFQIIGVEKCHENNDIYWRYNVEVQYPNEGKRIIKKRFNDFKKLHYKLDVNDKLPTSDWNIAPNNISEASDRGKQLNTYIQTLLNKNNTLSNSFFYSFIKESNNDELNDEDTNNKDIMNNDILPNCINNSFDKNIDQNINLTELVTETETFSNTLDIRLDNVSNLKRIFKTLINKDIDHIFTLYEINYFSVLKKRFFVINNEFLYKLRYDRIRKIFSVRNCISINDIKCIEKSVITNTSYFKDKDILIIKLNENLLINDILLVSLNNNTNYNIESFFLAFKSFISADKCQITTSYEYDNGTGLSEELLNHKYVKNLKTTITKQCASVWSMF